MTSAEPSSRATPAAPPAVPPAPSDPAGFAGIARLATRLGEVPAALVWLEGNPPAVAASCGLATGWTTQGLAAALPVCTSAGVVEVRDTRSDPLWSVSLLVTGPEAVRWALGIALHDAHGSLRGRLWLLDRATRRTDPAQLEALELLAAQARHLLAGVAKPGEDPLLPAEWHLSQQLMALSPLGIALYDADGNCVMANESVAAHAGCTVAQLLAQNMHRLESWQQSGIHQIAVCALSSGKRSSGVVRGTSSFGKPLVLSVDFSVLQAPVAGHLLMMTQDVSRLSRMEDARRELQDRFDMLFVNSMDGIFLGHPDGTVTAANPAACALMGMSEQAMLARGRHGLLDQSDPRLARMLEERRLTGRTRGEARVIRGDGSTVEVEISSMLYPDSEGRLLSSSILRDITLRRRLERQVEDSAELLSRLAQRVPGVIYQYRLYPDGRSCFPFASEGIRAIYEVAPEDVREDATPVFGRLHPDDVEAVVASIQQSASTLQPWHHEYRVVLPRQGTRWRLGDAAPELLEDGSVLWHGFITDITQRRHQEEQTHWLAYFDSLTSLPNRRLLADRMQHALAAARRSGDKGCLLFVDLDHFKRINDARGHAVGDQLLTQVAQRLLAVVRAQDTVARLGGDEFVVLLSELGRDPEVAARAAVTVAEKVRHALQVPYGIDGNDYSSHASIGITLFPKADESVDDLLREADTAMYRVKESGRDGIAFFEATMQAEVEQALALESDLKMAISRGQLDLHVQGQFDVDGHLAGAEVLLRWHHPRRGTIPPAQFIPVAEDTGLIVPIGEWVLEQAARALARMAACGLQLTLSVNLSPRQFRDDGFVDAVHRILQETGAPAHHLVFEVTERLLINDPGLAAARMSELRRTGVRFSLDDFGTGYASLRYLKKLPLYEIKIDREFVSGLPNDSNDMGVVNAIVSMAHQFRLRVVAEGVETPAQGEYLLNARCDALQGFLLARPMPLAKWLVEQTGEDPAAIPVPEDGA